ncbi:MAG: class IV adenylate cyclase [Flexilinea sp.]
MENNIKSHSANLEIEAKFPLESAADFLCVIEGMRLPCIQRDFRELNLRFDTPDRRLSKTHQVLRLRKDDESIILTYKGSETKTKKIAIREEIETRVSDYDQMKLILQNLGYEEFFIYEKIRSTYRLGETLLMIDHTPVGDFLEIEGPNEKLIKSSAKKLGVDWKTRTSKGYQKLFIEWAEAVHYKGRDMLFAEVELHS